MEKSKADRVGLLKNVKKINIRKKFSQKNLWQKNCINFNKLLEKGT